MLVHICHFLLQRLLQINANFTRFYCNKNFPKNDKSAFGSNALDQESQTFLCEDHISCYTKVQRPDILRNVMFRDMSHSTQINKCFVNILLFHC